MSKSKIIAAAWGFREMGTEKYLKCVKELGFAGVEIHVDSDPKEARNSLYSQATNVENKRIQSLSKKYGVDIASFAIGNDFTLGNDNDLLVQIEKVKKAVDLASKLNVSEIRIFAGFIDKSKITTTTYNKLWDCLNKVGDYAQKKKVCLCIENHGGITAGGEDCLKVLKNVKSSAIAINCDPANFCYYGEDPLVGLKKVAKYVQYTHWKDVHKRNGKLEYCALGEGIIDWKPIIAKLKDINYKGYYAVEYETIADVQRGAFLSANVLRMLGVK
ncbi:MAG: sugar phosphate isomerase/epimerase family protein [Candidatus Firestonebacteria bacterium]